MATQKQDVAETPMMRQYFEIKEKYPDAILLFRVGDFYETFLDDAVAASEILGITLTRRANGAAQFVELAGFPHHALDTYLPKLVRAGKRVAVCDQLEDPKKTKKLVKRGLTEMVTPGVAVGDNVLENKENNYLCALFPDGKRQYGISLVDYSTGQFVAGEGDASMVRKLLVGYCPKEILVESRYRSLIQETFHPSAFLCDYDDWIFSPSNNRDRLLRHFNCVTLKGYGLEDYPLAITAAGAILNYLDLTHHKAKGHIGTISRIDEGQYVRLDNFTFHSLELLQSMNNGGCSLMQVLDKTTTPMGARLLRHYISFPLKDVDQISQRQRIVGELYANNDLRNGLKPLLSEMGDVERLVSRVAMRRVTPKELLRLSQVLELMEPIAQLCAESAVLEVKNYAIELEQCPELLSRLKYQIHPQASNMINKGNVIAMGFSEELDELRRLAYHTQEFLLEMQEREIRETGISSLKIGFNNVFGYYLEVRNTHKESVPVQWIRKQTLVNAERYVTEELKQYEEKILGAQERILALETELFNALVEEMQPLVPLLQKNSFLLARLDVLLSFSLNAIAHKYVCPTVDNSRVLEIQEGRHPVIELQLPSQEQYVPNSVSLDPEECQIMVITGPNMSGKSALLRQTALIVLMAQMGSFVPAQSAHIGIVDAVFTRVGASDNISQGESTFMVEMQEASNILNNLSDRSLVLFDELGRGTSTFDGISIAWAIIEYIHNRPNMRPKTLFATHYHELNEIEGMMSRVHNFNVSAQEIEGKMLFLRKLVPGGSEHSFGIQVAKLAGMPHWIITRSSEVLRSLEAERIEENISESVSSPSVDVGNAAGKKKKTRRGAPEAIQMTLFQLEDPLLVQIRDELLDMDIDNMTPVEALRRLADIKTLLKNY